MHEQSGSPRRVLRASRALVLLAPVLPGCAQPALPAEPPAVLGYRVSGGAAPGYLEDRACAVCHAARWQSYQDVGMARSFSRPRREVFIEDFENGRFFHAASGRHYEMRRQGESLSFRAWSVGPDGKLEDVFERAVDWIVGSGHTSRVYLFQTELGELFQLPLAWYSQPARWGMAPGYDARGHPEARRLVRRECFFCHNAYPDTAAGSDLRERPHIFPKRLPEGTGCQRCHGPGAEHARRASAGEVDLAGVRAAIVNPARLSPALRRDVCYQCHYQPAVALPGLRRFDRADFSFRPGEPLSAYLVQVDVEMQGMPKRERFEINHHPYRLEQSRCFQASRNRDRPLECLSCHDPHRKVTPGERAAHYRTACLACHAVEACRRAAAGSTSATGGDDCVSCHMPRRRTQDVVHVVMTDHLIQRAPGGGLLAPLAEREPVLTDVRLLAPETVSPELVPVYRALAVLRAGGNVAAVDHLTALLDRTDSPWPTPYLDLARSQLLLQRYDAAERSLRAALARGGEGATAFDALGVAEAGRGRSAAALAALRRAVELEPQRPETRYNLGRVLLGQRRAAEALEQFQEAVRLRPTFARAWNEAGEAHAASGHAEAALHSWRLALALDPTLDGTRRRIQAAVGR